MSNNKKKLYKQRITDQQAREMNRSYLDLLNNVARDYYILGKRSLPDKMDYLRTQGTNIYDWLDEHNWKPGQSIQLINKYAAVGIDNIRLVDDPDSMTPAGAKVIDPEQVKKNPNPKSIHVDGLIYHANFMQGTNHDFDDVYWTALAGVLSGLDRDTFMMYEPGRDWVDHGTPMIPVKAILMMESGVCTAIYNDTGVDGRESWDQPLSEIGFVEAAPMDKFTVRPILQKKAVNGTYTFRYRRSMVDDVYSNCFRYNLEHPDGDKIAVYTWTDRHIDHENGRPYKQ